MGFTEDHFGELLTEDDFDSSEIELSITEDLGLSILENHPLMDMEVDDESFLMEQLYDEEQTYHMYSQYESNQLYSKNPQPAYITNPEQIIGSDDRVHCTNTRVKPFRWVCQIMTSTGLGSGTLIGNNKVLTAAHVVWDDKDNPGRITVVPGRKSAGTSATAMPYGSAKGTSVNIPSTYGHVPNVWEEDDYAVITLDTNIGATVGDFWSDIRAIDAARVRPASVNVAGYPGDKGGNQMWRSYGRVTSVSGEKIEYENDTRGGMSGSPIWLRWRTARMLIGVHQIGDDGTGTVANRGVFISSAILTKIRSWL